MICFMFNFCRRLIIIYILIEFHCITFINSYRKFNLSFDKESAYLIIIDYGYFLLIPFNSQIFYH